MNKNVNKKKENKKSNPSEKSKDLLVLRQKQAEEMAALKNESFSIIDELDKLKNSLLVDDINETETKINKVNLDNSKEYSSEKERPAEKALEKKLNNLKFNKRLLDSLKAAGVVKVKDLVQKSKNEVLAIKGVGPKSLETIEAQLNQVGLKLNDSKVKGGKPVSKPTGSKKEMDKKDSTKKVTNEANASRAKSFFETRIKSGGPVQASGEDSTEGIITNLQKLREQIAAQKNLERQLMEAEAELIKEKELAIQRKLSEIEVHVKNESYEGGNLEISELKKQNQELVDEYNKIKSQFDKVLSLKYDQENIIDKESLTLSEQFVNKITKDDSAEINSELARVQKEFTELQQEQEANRNNLINTHNIKKSELRAEIEAANKKIKNYQKQVNDLKEAANAPEEINKTLSERNEKIALLERELQAEKSKHSKLRKQIEDKDKRVATLEKELKAEIAEANEKIKDYQKQIKGLKAAPNTPEEVNKILDERNAKIASLENDLQTEKSKFDKLQKELEDKNKKIATLEEEKQKLNQAIKDNQARLTELEKHEEKIKTLTLNLENREQELNQAKKELEEIKENEEKLNLELKSKEKEIETLVNEHRVKVEKMEKEYEKIKEQGENKGLVDEYLQKLKDEREKHSREISELNKEIEKEKYINIAQKEVLKNTEDRLSAQIEKLKQALDTEKQNFQTYRENISKNKNERINQLQNEVNKQKVLIQNYKDDIEKEAKEQIKALQEEYQKREDEVKEDYKNEEARLLREIDKSSSKISVLENLLTEYKYELEKLSQRVKTLREELKEEKNKHYEIEQKLFNDLDAREQEIMSLKRQLDKEKNKDKDFDKQMEVISSFIAELENSNKKQTSQAKASDNLFTQQNSVEEMRKAYEEEIKRRDEIISSLQEKPKEPEIDGEYEDKIESLESQIQELGSFIKSLSHKETKKEESNDIINDINAELEKFKAEIRAEFAKKAEMEIHLEPEVIEDESDEPLVTPEVKLSEEASEDTEEIEEEFFEEEVLDTKPEEVQEVTYEEVEEEAIHTEALEETPEEEVEEETLETEDLEEIQEETSSEETEEEKLIEKEKPEKELGETIGLIVESQKEETEKKQAKAQSTPNNVGFVGKVDAEYLHRLNNIRRLQKVLDDKKAEINARYEAEFEDNVKAQKEFQEKIDNTQEKIDELNETFKLENDNSNEAKETYEKERTKLYLELQAREEQLRKAKDDDVRKLTLRRRSELKNIDEQIDALFREEQELKDSFLLRQQKQESKLKREEEMLTKLKAEQAREAEAQKELEAEVDHEDTTEAIVSEATNEDEKILSENGEAETQEEPEIPKPQYTTNEEERVIESQEEKKQKLFQQNVEQQHLELEAEEQKPDSKVKEKEAQLRQIYERYAVAEKKLSTDFRDVKTYKANKAEKLGYQKELEKLQEELNEFNKALKQTNDQEEIIKINKEIIGVKAKIKNSNSRMEYLQRQMDTLKNNKNVSQYIQLTDKLDTMKKILLKYAQDQRKVGSS